MSDTLKPKNFIEEIAVFRAQVIGPLLCRHQPDHGDVAATLRELAEQPLKPPGQERSRHYSVPTLQRWYYAFKAHGLEGLKPKGRAAGFALGLDPATRELLLAIRREQPRVSTALILRTLERDGRLRRGELSAPTLRRLYAAHGLDRHRLTTDERPRRRWEAAAPGQLWHTDVCHGPTLRVGRRALPLRIHALLDDHSRYVPAIQACSSERETEMLALMVKGLRQHGAPDGVYADNGPTYVGDALSTLCARLGIALVHAKPHDPQARGKMERFWRTLREQCLDHLGTCSSLHEVQVRLLAWLDRHYHVTPHSSLMGKTPAEAFATNARQPTPDIMLREALVVRGKRRVRRDATLSVAGTEFELEPAFLAGQIVTVARSLLDPTELPWVEHEEQRHVLQPVAPQKNATRKRPKCRKGIDAVAFDPPGALLDEALGRKVPR